MDFQQQPVAQWWRDDFALRRYLSDALIGELNTLRRGQFAWGGESPMSNAVCLGDGGLGADSLERLQLATALSSLVPMDREGCQLSILPSANFGDWCAAAAQALSNDNTSLGFRSSGSTGIASLTRHAVTALTEETEELYRILEQRQRILSAVACHHVYGFLFTVLLARRMGSPLVEDLRRTAPNCLVAESRPGDLIVGHPIFWRAVAEGNGQFKADVLGVTSGAPCPAELMMALTAKGLRLIDVFGSTETAGIGWREDPDHPYQLFPFWAWASDSHGDLALARTIEGVPRVFTLLDELVQKGERGFLPRGRRDHIVQVGGINVSPAAVRRRLLSHPWISDAAVRLMRPTEGCRLKAFLVAKAGISIGSNEESTLQEWIDAHLSVPERPRALRFGTALPVSASGKPADWDV